MTGEDVGARGATGSDTPPTPEYDDTRLPVGDRLRLRWWRFLDLFHRCAECGHWPDAHRDSIGPRWDEDKTAHMLGIGRFGCRRCGHGAIEERDARAAVIEELATEAEVWADGEDESGAVLAEWLRSHIRPGRSS